MRDAFIFALILQRGEVFDALIGSPVNAFPAAFEVFFFIAGYIFIEFFGVSNGIEPDCGNGVAAQVFFGGYDAALQAFFLPKKERMPQTWQQPSDKQPR